MQLLNLTANAEKHFADLLKEQADGDDLQLRIYVSDPGTPRADIDLSFCPLEEKEDTDLVLTYNSFDLFIEQDSAPALQDAVIDYQINDTGGKLSVRAPNLRAPAIGADASLEQKVQHSIDTEINPSLASHKGYVTLVEIDSANRVVLRFGGGCQGCGMADFTLKNTIRKTLLERHPEIKEVLDATEHEKGETPYY